MAFRLSRDLHAYVRFLLTKPESNDYVNRSIVASSWNRGQAFVAMSRVRLGGTYTPALVSIRARRGGRVVSGFALDFVRHPVIGIPVVLERQSGRGWRRVATVRTTRIGELPVQGCAGQVSRPCPARLTVRRPVARSVRAAR